MDDLVDDNNISCNWTIRTGKPFNVTQQSKQFTDILYSMFSSFSLNGG